MRSRPTATGDAAGDTPEVDGGAVVGGVHPERPADVHDRIPADAHAPTPADAPPGTSLPQPADHHPGKRTPQPAEPRPQPAHTAVKDAPDLPMPIPHPTPASTHPPTAPSNRFLARATLLSAALSMAGALLGLGRDQVLAHFFGAGADTDAFLVAWTVPEMASTLLIEDGMAFVLVPAFSVALARRARGIGGLDPVLALVAGTLPRLCLALAGTAAVLVAGAPLLVSVLAPGLPDPSLAVSCTRLTATCVLSFGLAGYCGAALRAHGSYLAPGSIYIAYNATIIATMFVLTEHWGVRSAALGVALGGCFMAAMQAPFLWRRIAGRPGRSGDGAAMDGGAVDGGAAALADVRVGADAARRAPLPTQTLAFGLVCAVLLFALCRQSQVLIERYFASGLPAGAISHLNYAQKVAQLPMSLALMVCVVTFPVVARAIADGDTRRAGDRVERDLVLTACLVLFGAAVVVACAPQIVQLLFQRGAFTAQDTATTAAVMRVYAAGLLGHTLVGALVMSYFSVGRTTWYPLGAMVAGALATVALSAWAVQPWGARGIAGANAAGITVTALLLLHGLGPRTVPVRVRRVVAGLARPVCAAVCATGAGLVGAGLFTSPAVSVAAGCTCVAAVFLLLAWILDAAGARSLLAPVGHSVHRSVTRKLRHGR